MAVCGVDLAVRALRLAARRYPEATWVVANADRRLPLADASVDLALSLYGRRPGPELARVLRSDGRLVVGVAGEDDLVELREAVLGRGQLRRRGPAAVAALRERFELLARSSWRERAFHDRQALGDALAMTYRGQRAGQAARASRLDGLEVTLSAELLLLRRRS